MLLKRLNNTISYFLCGKEFAMFALVSSVAYSRDEMLWNEQSTDIKCLQREQKECLIFYENNFFFVTQNNNFKFFLLNFSVFYIENGNSGVVMKTLICKCKTLGECLICTNSK